ncbi:MAG: SUMF1/EgtB/PvdO family nonheme iron enzyme [Deltaproteobacteria bacterium]|nr:SUMF1/EgtB/PvdO family nonheme iron enzyme [Deltaproteobacteria bacterium]
MAENLEAHGGQAFLVVSRRGCSPSTIPLRLPGYAQRDLVESTLRVRVPVCHASVVDMIAIPAGSFIYGGLGEPPSREQAEFPDGKSERKIELPMFGIDRTEVTNAAFSIFGEMSRITGVETPRIPQTTGLEKATAPRKPITGIVWSAARAYCRFLGKELPTSEQWVKAMRGGERLGDQPNPMPRRNYPWGGRANAMIAAIDMDGKETPDVAGHPGDTSPYGVIDLAGSLTEWTASPVADEPGTRIVRGGNYGETKPETLADYMAIENRRAAKHVFLIGVRCVTTPAVSSTRP